jgi:hypothetical protein
MKNLYLISQSVKSGFDTYDSAVVAADSEESARLIRPYDGDDWYEFDNNEEKWCSPEDVIVRLIGIAVEGVDGVICASYNPG